MSCFSREETRVKARELLIQRIQEEMDDKQTGMPQRKTSSSSMSGEEESWEQLAKRRRMERQKEVVKWLLSPLLYAPDLLISPPLSSYSLFIEIFLLNITMSFFLD